MPSKLAQHMLCAHPWIHCTQHTKHLSGWGELSVNLALSGENLNGGRSGASRCVLNKGLRVWCGASKGVTDCSAILADPRCVLNIKSSAVIPLTAPNTNRGLLVAMETALLSNIASSESASLFVSLFPFLFFSFSSSSLFHLCVACVNNTAWIFVAVACPAPCWSLILMHSVFNVL